MLKGKWKIEEKITITTDYLKSLGCREIILFGSLAIGDADEFYDSYLALSVISPRT